MSDIFKENIDEVKQIGELIMQGIQAWLDAGKLLVKVLDSGESLESVANRCGLSKDVLYRFEQIGRSQLYPKLLASTSEGARALSLCGFSEQKQFSESPIPVLIEGNGKYEVLNIEMDNLTPRQVKQVFCRGHVRTNAEQRAWIEDQKAKEKAKYIDESAITMPYVIRGKTVQFVRGAEMTKQELTAILARMK